MGGEELRRTGGEFTTLIGREFGMMLLQPFFGGRRLEQDDAKEAVVATNASAFPVEISMAEDLVTVFELCSLCA